MPEPHSWRFWLIWSEVEASDEAETRIQISTFRKDKTLESIEVSVYDIR